MALVNAYAAVETGVRRFDTSVRGLGGSPFADDAGGNLATEEFVYLVGTLGHDTGIDLEALGKVSLAVAEMLEKEARPRLLFDEIGSSGPEAPAALIEKEPR